MTSSKLLMASIAVALVIYGVGAESGIEELRSRISALESSISDTIQNIKTRDQSIKNFENIIKEKSASIFSLLSEIEMLGKQAAADAEQLGEKVHKHASEMEKQVARLKSEIEANSIKSGALAARGAEVAKKAQDLNLKLESLQEYYDKQKLRITSCECALQAAEEELMKAQLESASKLKKLTEKWIPAATVLMMSFASIVQHYAQLLPTKSMKVYEASKKNMAPLIMKAHELADPYFLETWNFSKPYVDQIANVAKPNVEKLQVFLDTYQRLSVHSYRRLAKTILSYHNQVKVSVLENLKKHELTKPIATRELASFLASAILALPMFFLLRLLSAIFCNKTECVQSANRDNAPNNHKRKYGCK